MTALRGGAIDEMQQMAKTWGAQAGQLRQLTTSLNGTTANSTAIWTGPGADKFRAEWQQCRAAFEKMATTLDDGSTAITKYANNIQAATA
jgi:WXG100 family type VII secretion target